MAFLVAISLFSIGYGVYAMICSGRIAEQNAAFIASGEETYFEQRRSWQAYGTTPPDDMAAVRKRGRREIIIGAIGLIVAALFTYFAN
ncbi:MULTISPECIES: hypothetical protein [Sphingobium]|jgi:hypothetical protein|uniref:Uncharacterized protein n=1 Tax=Sphingobium yanoikuyae TaxID=13690 RepID=A0A0J9FXI8_SPHYA|nr:MULTISPECIES: hypothetical protein [Sphingobium]ATP17058.1 hypothetical protein BV87_00710 [Sphingobium yanoikuyae]KMW32890.1 hypothetical protein BV87_00770 [Sphingobium yanoikuyae]QHD69938.1 hypothetical protein GS397_24875 [Sphingobium yanoikuyae]TKV44359.1 hypothetical protein A0U87_08955 [Sphingobium sp. MP9-4]